MRHVFKLGPLTDQSPRCLYLALHETAEIASVEADSDVEGLRALQSMNLGPLSCHEDLASAASELGLPIGELPEDALMQCAVIAMMTGNPLLSEEVIPAMPEFFEVYRDFLEFQPWLALDVDEILKITLTNPRREWEAVLFGGEQPAGLSLCPIRGALAASIESKAEGEDIGAESLFSFATRQRPGLAKALAPFTGSDEFPFFVSFMRRTQPHRFSLKDFLTLTAALDAATKLAIGEGPVGFAGEGKSEVTATAVRLEEAPEPEPTPAPEEDTGDKIPRNALCPCGSGKKYKKCHEGQPLPVGGKPLAPISVEQFGSDAVTPWRLQGTPNLGESELSLDERGEHFFSVSTELEKLVIQKVSVREQRVVSATMFAFDVPLEQPNLLLDGDALVVAAGDQLLTFSASDLSLQTRQVLPKGAVKSLRQPLDTMVLPGQRFAWTRGERGGVVVIDLKNRTHVEVSEEGNTPHVLPSAGGLHVFLPEVPTAGSVFDASGGHLDDFNGEVSDVGAPTGGYPLVRVECDDEEFGPLAITFEREDGTVDEHEVLEDVWLYGLDGLISCLDPQMVVLPYTKDDAVWLVAYGAKGDGLETLWRVKTPEGLRFVQDRKLRRAVVIATTPVGLQCHTLTREAPPEWLDVRRLPSPRAHRSCAVWGADVYELVAPLIWEKNAKQRARNLKSFVADTPSVGNALQLLADCRERGDAVLVRSAIIARWGEQPAFGLQDAGDDAEAGRHAQALTRLGAEPFAGLSSAERAHWHHLRGATLFSLGRYDEARASFETMRAQPEGNCSSQGWLEWLAAWKSGAGPLGEWLARTRKGDEALAAGRFNEALDLYDAPITMSHGDAQHAARIVFALTGATVSSLRRAQLLEWASGKLVSLDFDGPWGPLTWPTSRLKEARRLLPRFRPGRPSNSDP